MELIWLGHIVGDFYLQSNKVAKGKQNSFLYMLLHLALYSTIVTACFAFLCHDTWKILGIFAIVFLSHFIIDFAKIKCSKSYRDKEYIFFIVDQLFHVLVLFFVYWIFKTDAGKLSEKCFYVAGFDKFFTIGNIIMMISSLLFCARPAAILIYKIINAITVPMNRQTSNEIVDRVAGQVDGEAILNHSEGDCSKSTIRIGCWIGILEREIILFLGLLGQFGAIGFVLTAKSLARFKQLEDKSFAEKYIVGTLLSSFVAIVCIFVCKLVM